MKSSLLTLQKTQGLKDLNGDCSLFLYPVNYLTNLSAAIT